jgi:hAT family C-terminal dimerisation region
LVEQILMSLGTTDDDTHKWDIGISSYSACKSTAFEADDAVLFWKTYAAKYPTLQDVARCYLSISALSVPVESMFPITGLILNSESSVV